MMISNLKIWFWSGMQDFKTRESMESLITYGRDPTIFQLLVVKTHTFDRIPMKTELLQDHSMVSFWSIILTHKVQFW